MERHHIKVVRHLLAKAGSTNSPEEAAACVAKAQAFMAKYAIEEAQLNEANDQVLCQELWVSGPYARAKAGMLSALAEANFGKVVYEHCLDKGRLRVWVFGRQTCLDALSLLWPSLEVQVLTQAASYSGKAARHSFILGFTTAVRIRLREVLSQAEQDHGVNEGNARALVLLHDRRPIDAAIAERLGRLGTARGPSVSDPSAYVSGHRAGDHADIGNPRVGTRRQLAPAG